MAAKAVYMNVTLAIYCTRDELAVLMRGEPVAAPLIAAGGVLVDQGATITLSPAAVGALAPLYQIEQATYLSVKRKPSGHIQYGRPKKRRLS